MLVALIVIVQVINWDVTFIIGGGTGSKKGGGGVYEKN